MRRGLVVALVASLFLVAFAGGRPSAISARPAADPDIIVTMFGSVVEFHTLPTTVVLAELADAEGPKATGEGISDGYGKALVQFLPLPATRDRFIRPGDRISLARIGARNVVIDVPELTVDVDAAAGRVVGTAPAGQSVVVEVAAGGSAPIQHAAVADGGGQFAVDYGPLQGEVSGTATYDDPEGRRFIAKFAEMSAEITLGGGSLTGRAASGTLAAVAIARSGNPLYQATAEVVDGTAWSIPLPAGGVQSGDQVTVTKSLGPVVEVPPLVATAPDIAFDIDPAHERVSGTAEPGATVVASAVSIFGQSATQETTAGADGAFALDLAGMADLGPGWRVRVDTLAAPRMRIGRLKVIPQALIGVHTSVVRGVAPPTAPVTVTLRTEDGTLKASVPTRADDDGTFAARLGGLLPGVAVTMEAGDILEVTFLAGDPIVVPVPQLDASCDPDADVVRGRAQPGAEVTVRVLSDPSAPVATATAAADGSFRVDFSGGTPYDLRRPANGTATVQASGPAMFYTSWAAVQVNPEIGSGAFTASGPPGRAYSVQLLAPDGKVVATSQGTTYDFSDISDIVMLGSLQGFFVVQFEDSTGQPVDVRSGDTLVVTAGDDAVRLVIPPLDGVVFVEDDVLAGQTTPDTDVAVTVESLTGARATAAVRSDATGAFTHEFAGTHDIQYNDTVQLAVVVDGHNVTKRVDVPGLLVDLDEASVTGTVAPAKPLTVTALRGTVVLSSAKAQSDADGAFSAVLLDAGGSPVLLVEGDKIEVRQDGGEAVSMTVPLLEIQADSATDVISGRATPGGVLVLLVLRQVLDTTGFGIAQGWPVIEPSGAWTAALIPSHDVKPGTTVLAQYRLASGHMAIRSHVVPLLAVDDGTPNLCGFAPPRSAVSAQLRDPAGSQLGSARGTTEPAGKYEMVLRDAAGAMVTSGVSQTVSADLAGAAAQVTLPELVINPDWAAQTMSGVGPPLTLMFGIFPAARCLNILTAGADALQGVTYAFTGPDGSFANAPLPQVAPGQGVELAYQTPDGHLVFRQVYRAKGQVYIDTDRVAGLTNSIAEVHLTLRGDDGSELATVSGSAGPLGDFDLRFAPSPAGPVVIAAGDTVVLDAASDHAEILVEPLSFDWSPGAAVSGQAPPGRALVVHLRLRDGRVFSVQTVSNVAGRFSFGADDVPPRASWSLADVVAVRVVLPTPSGHEIVSQTAGYEAPVEERGATVFLPVAVRHASFGGATAAAPSTPAEAARSAVTRWRAPATVVRPWQAGDVRMAAMRSALGRAVAAATVEEVRGR